ncbi:MAG: hypothetical protein RH947_13005 [Alcanivorax sp.]
MEKVETKKGIVGFFDILGYTNFLQNNEAEQAARVVVDILNKIDRKVPELCSDIFDDAKSEFTDVIERIEWLVFSDTILMALPWQQGEIDEIRFNEWVAFTMAAQVLSRLMFDVGLPLRGGITVGEFLVEGNCFAGTPIIEAYRLSESLELSATALSPAAQEDLKNLFRNSGYTWSHMYQEYLVPKKNHINEKHLVLSPTPCVMPHIGDISQMVAESFFGNKKDVPPNVIHKLKNTEMYFRYVKMVHGHIFLENDEGFNSDKSEES